MKFSDRKELNRHIKIGIPLPVYVIYGSEGLLKKKALDQIISMVTGGDEYALSRLPGDTPVLTIATDLYELSFSGARRLVVADDMPIPSLIEGQKKELDKLIKEITKDNDAGVLLFYFSLLDYSSKKTKDEKRANEKFNTFIRQIDKLGGGVIELNKLPSPELSDMLMKVAEKNGAHLERRLASYMVERCGADAQKLQNELKKLCLYVGKKEITQSDIDYITIEEPCNNVFLLAEKIGCHDSKGALKLTDDLLSIGEEPEVLLHHISDSFENISIAKAAKAMGKSSNDLIKDFPTNFGGNRSFLATRSFNSASNFSEERLRKSMDIIVDGTLRMRSFPSSKENTLYEVIIKLLAKR